MRTQCQLLGVTRSSLSYLPKPGREDDAKLARLLDEIYLRDPCLGTRRLVSVLARDHDLVVNRKRFNAYVARWVWRPSTAVRAPASRTKHIASIRICCAI